MLLLLLLLLLLLRRRLLLRLLLGYAGRVHGEAGHRAAHHVKVWWQLGLRSIGGLDAGPVWRAGVRRLVRHYADHTASAPVCPGARPSTGPWRGAETLFAPAIIRREGTTAAAAALQPAPSSGERDVTTSREQREPGSPNGPTGTAATEERATLRTGGRGPDGRERLTLAVSGHVRHGGILHHGGRASAGHHVGIPGKGPLGTHGELLGVVHHLLLLGLVGRQARLHLRVLAWRGAVEGWPGGIWKAVRGRVHGLR